MKHLEALRRNVDRFARKHDLEIDQIAAFADGVYRVELKSKANEPRKVTGFCIDRAAHP